MKSVTQLIDLSTNPPIVAAPALSCFGEVKAGAVMFPTLIIGL